MSRKTKTANQYTGSLSLNQIFINKYGGEVVKIDAIKKRPDGLWVVKIIYIESKTNKDPLDVIAYDFENKIKSGLWIELI